MSTQFKVGDRVRVRAQHSSFTGKEGMIVDIDPLTGHLPIKVDVGGVYGFRAHELELVQSAPVRGGSVTIQYMDEVGILVPAEFIIEKAFTRCTSHSWADTGGMLWSNCTKCEVGGHWDKSRMSYVADA